MLKLVLAPSLFQTLFKAHEEPDGNHQGLLWVGKQQGVESWSLGPLLQEKRALQHHRWLWMARGKHEVWLPSESASDQGFRPKKHHQGAFGCWTWEVGPLGKRTHSDSLPCLKLLPKFIFAAMTVHSHP